MPTNDIKWKSRHTKTDSTQAQTKEKQSNQLPLPQQGAYHYENVPIQIYRKFHLQKLKIFR